MEFRSRLAAFWRTPAARDSLFALLASRLLIWAVGVPAYLKVGIGPDAKYDHSLLTQSQGPIGNALIAPAVRWDSNWYVDTAVAGYLREDVQTVFYPLYPLLMRALGTVTGSVLVAGIAISFVAFFAALVMLHRLTERELGADAARRTVYLLAFFPFALFFSAIYTEALFLALELGALWAARRGRWWLAGLLGGLGAATRNTGILLAPVLLVLYLYGPRDDASAREQPARGPSERASSLRFRYPLRPEVLWLALVPAGLAAYLAYLGSRYGNPLVPFGAQAEFQRSFAGPLSAVWLGAVEAARSAVALATGGGGAAAARQIALFGVAVTALVATGGVLRRLPPVYGVYTVLGVFAALSFPQDGNPMASIGRYLVVGFPLFMWAGWRLRDRRLYIAVLVVFAVGLAYASAMFSTWRFVA